MENKEETELTTFDCWTWVPVLIALMVIGLFSVVNWIGNKLDGDSEEKTYSVTLDCSGYKSDAGFTQSRDCIQSKFHVVSANGTTRNLELEYDFSGNNPPQEPKEVIKEVSVVAEAENCKKMAGNFELEHDLVFTMDGKKPIRISCTKAYTEGNKEIKETLFEHELKY
jgi:hypothetical protein